ncbi:MAG: hypothetical protein AB7F86_07945, partial [Bdellovibrionales bacterium]
MSIDRYIVVDEDGYFSFDGVRVSDLAVGQEMMAHMQVDDWGRFQTSLAGKSAWVEAFDCA